MWLDIEILLIIKRAMFPYNEVENDWISKIKRQPSTYKIKTISKVRDISDYQSIVKTLFFVFMTALLTASLPPLIYFLRTGIF